MEKEMIELIREYNLSPFSKSKASIRSKEKSIFVTSDAKSVFNKTLAKISQDFCFSDTSNLWNCFQFTEKIEDIMRRQDFFKNIKKTNKDFLEKLQIPKKCWKPKYGIVAVTEDEPTFGELQKLGIPCQFISNQQDMQGLDDYDIVQVVNCDETSIALEKLPQTVFLDSLEDVYLERHLETLSAWKNNLEILEKSELNEEIKRLVDELVPLAKLLAGKQEDNLSRESVEKACEKINQDISEKIKSMSVSGDSLLGMLSRGKLPDELKSIVESAIDSSGLDNSLFITSIPVQIDENELEKRIKLQSVNEHTTQAEIVKKNAERLKKVDENIRKIEQYLLIFDFTSAMSSIIENNKFFPEMSDQFYFTDAENILLDSAQPISFSLNSENKCSMLTGANSGGKTTLLEHVIQLITFFQLGLPTKGKVSMPIFSEIYYFAKNKGSASKGAFETLLTQLARIKPGNQTLILADEIEAVTEPGVAGKIICASADFFIKKKCFLVIATHLGHEIQKSLPLRARVDGIEAKGLDENNELIVDHNPVLGRLASSTPELIVEKMAKTNPEEYFQFLRDSLKK